MNKISTLLKILTVLGFLQFFVIASVAQEKSESSVLTNESVIELVKSGISEGIVLAKIKNSDSNFDTSSAALVKLKESGVSENIIMAMIEAKPKIAEDEDNKTENQITADMKQAVGKRKIFLISEDEESKLIIIKKLVEKGFSFVETKKSAELIMELSYVEATTQQKTGIFKNGSNTEYQSKIGKLTVKVKKDSSEGLVYAYEYPLSRNANTAAIFGVSPAPLSLRDQVKLYLVDNFLKQMKKAGDKFK